MSTRAERSDNPSFMDEWRTAIVRSEASAIWIHGHDVTDLMRRATFTDVIFLLHRGRLPDERERKLIDAILIGVADPGPAAPSCAAARLVASGNRQSMSAAVAAGVLAVRALLEKKVDVNAAEADGTTALHWASYRDDLDSANLLIRAGARVNAANDLGATPLWTASLNGSAAMVRALLEAGANPNAALLLGETPVMVASRTRISEGCAPWRVMKMRVCIAQSLVRPNDM
jgi:hypothetical protein